MIVATAGHIDHGKTSLVRAITGVDTDRLPEEKARGISIDLGFAYWTSPGGALIGFVDVPGHERFVRNMLAGVCGIDFALVVVAADDGVMPQTIEHVQILDLLRIRHGLAVITKIDRVSAERRAQVRAEITSLLAGTTLQDVDTAEASAVTGEGLDAIKTTLAEAAERMEPRLRSGQHFRFSIDRAFTIEGSGTVVTGTVFSGATETGARLRLSPRGIPVRVRGLRVHASDVKEVHAGQRCAINLTGVAVTDVARGDWVLDESIDRSTQRIDAQLVLLSGAHVALTPATRLHVHLGAADVLARVIPIGTEVPAPGQPAFVQFVLEHPVCALHGDRFIVRDSAANRTLGGGVVLDPFVASARRRAPERLRSLRALTAPSPAQALQGLLDEPAGVDLERFETMFNLVPDAARALYSSGDVMVIGGARRTGIRRAVYDAWSQAVPATLSDFHKRNPAVDGMRIKDVRDAVAPALPLALFETFVQEVAASGRIHIKSGVARLPEHDAAANPADRRLWERAYPILLDAGIKSPRLEELARETGIDERTLRDLLYRRRATGTVYRIGADRFCLRESLASLAASATLLAQSSPNGTFTAADFRTAIGTGRTLAIEILECLDGVGVTLRVGDARRIRQDFAPLLGPAKPVRGGDAQGAANGKPASKSSTPSRTNRPHPR